MYKMPVISGQPQNGMYLAFELDSTFFSWGFSDPRCNNPGTVPQSAPGGSYGG